MDCLEKKPIALYKNMLRNHGKTILLFSKAYQKIKWKSKDYSMESEMIANAGKHNLKYDEIPIETIYSEKYKGTTILDGIKIVINMVLWRLKR